MSKTNLTVSTQLRNRINRHISNIHLNEGKKLTIEKVLNMALEQIELEETEIIAKRTRLLIRNIRSNWEELKELDSKYDIIAADEYDKLTEVDFQELLDGVNEWEHEDEED
jgi:hypothetical protein